MHIFMYIYIYFYIHTGIYVYVFAIFLYTFAMYSSHLFCKRYIEGPWTCRSAGIFEGRQIWDVYFFQLVCGPCATDQFLFVKGMLMDRGPAGLLELSKTVRFGRCIFSQLAGGPSARADRWRIQACINI